MLFENILRKIIWSTKEEHYTKCPCCKANVSWDKKRKCYIINDRPCMTEINKYGYHYICYCGYILKKRKFNPVQKAGYGVHLFFNKIAKIMDKLEGRM